jgi:hypothetical protein
MRIKRSDLNVFVLDCDFGLGIVTQGKPESMLKIPESNMEKLTYDDLVKNRRTWLNLKDENDLPTFLRTVGA